MSKFSVEHERISSHQFRACGDTIYEGYLTFSVPEGQLAGSKWMHSGPAIETVKEYIRLMAVDFEEDGLNWFRPQLKKLEQVSPGRWHYLIERVYLD